MILVAFHILFVYFLDFLVPGVWHLMPWPSCLPLIITSGTEYIEQPELIKNTAFTDNYPNTQGFIGFSFFGILTSRSISYTSSRFHRGMDHCALSLGTLRLACFFLLCLPWLLFLLRLPDFSNRTDFSPFHQIELLPEEMPILLLPFSVHDCIQRMDSWNHTYPSFFA